MEHITALPEETRLEEYEIRQILGQGGFGITYLAEDTHLGKRVAVKEYLPRDFATRGVGSTVTPISSAEAADYRWGLDRFLDEGRALARFDHRHLNKVQRYFQANGTAYLVLEYIEGETLSAVLQREGQLSQAQVERLLREVLSGLEEVHAAGYVHRDLTPGNLMLRREDGSAVVLDFGAARQAVSQRSKRMTSMGTPGYQPIEQYDSTAVAVGPRSDLYALGMVAYRCVSGLGDGELPDAVTRSRAVRKGSGELEPAASIGRGQYDGRLLRAIDWAIQVEEEDRPQSIGEWRQALPALDLQRPAAPVRSSPPSVPAPERSIADAERSAPSLPRWATVAGIAALLVAVGAGAHWLGQHTSDPGEVASRPPVAETPQAENQASPTSESTGPVAEPDRSPAVPTEADPQPESSQQAVPREARAEETAHQGQEHLLPHDCANVEALSYKNAQCICVQTLAGAEVPDIAAIEAIHDELTAGNPSSGWAATHINGALLGCVSECREAFESDIARLERYNEDERQEEERFDALRERSHIEKALPHCQPGYGFDGYSLVEYLRCNNPPGTWTEDELEQMEWHWSSVHERFYEVGRFIGNDTLKRYRTARRSCMAACCGMDSPI